MKRNTFLYRELYRTTFGELNKKHWVNLFYYYNLSAFICHVFFMNPYFLT